MKKIAVALAICLGILSFILILALVTPLPVPYYQDFSVMYYTGRSLLHGISIYDYSGQLTYVKTLTPATFTFYPYPYPPWYALVTVFLAFLPIQVAARVWFILNFCMLGTVAWLLTPGWKPIQRGLGLLAVIFFIPAFGLLIVGQYSVPVLLGCVLFIQAARQKSSYLTALSLGLMTFKPHIGFLLLLAGIVWLYRQKTTYGYTSLVLIFRAAILLGLLGFLADPAWPITYFQSLARYGEIQGVQTCGLCASLSVTILWLLTGQSNTLLSAPIGLSLIIILGLLLITRFQSTLEDPGLLMLLFATLTLIVDPYLLNYDYILLIPALFWLFRRARYWTIVLYILPCMALLLQQKMTNSLLVASGLVTFFLILRFSPKSMDTQD